MTSDAELSVHAFSESSCADDRTAKLVAEVTTCFEQNRAAVYRHLAGMGVSPGEAEELTQEAFLRLYRSLHSGRKIRNARSWVFRVAHNLAVELRKKRRPDCAPTGAVEDAPDPKLDPEQRALQSERLTRLKAAWTTLTPRQKQCLRLRGEGLKYREIAEVLRISLSTVADSLERSISKIQKALPAILLALVLPVHGQAQEPVVKVTTRLVVVDVVAKDKRGNPVLDLRPEDLQVFEEKVPQQIRHFWLSQRSTREVEKTEIPPGVYTNWLAPKIGNAPPTILLLDGLNTRMASQSVVRAQMLRMLKDLPPGTPIAVFALSRRLLLLQDFTSDPTLLQQAIDRSLNAVGDAMLDQDYRDDPNSITNMLKESEDFLSEGLQLPSSGGSAQGPGGQGELDLLAMIKAFMSNMEAEKQALRTDIRVNLTLAALSAIARYSAGYKGRKSLIWISASFPLSILPGGTGAANPFRGTRNYGQQVETTTRMLADAQVAIYPVNAEGVQAPAIFDVTNAQLPVYGKSRVPVGNALTNRLGREFESRMSLRDSMHQLAEQTGGVLCPENNALDECVLKAVEDSSSYYLLGYRPTNTEWDGSFRRIKVKTTRKGVKLRYRRGYYAGNASKTKDHTDNLKEAVLGNPWPTTEIMLVARVMSPETPDSARYFLTIEGKELTFLSEQRRVVLNLGLGLFDRDGNLLNYSERRSYEFSYITIGTDRAGRVDTYSTVHFEGGTNVPFALVNIVKIDPKAVRVRLAVQDSASGQIGTVDVPVHPSKAPP